MEVTEAGEEGGFLQHDRAVPFVAPLWLQYITVGYCHCQAAGQRWLFGCFTAGQGWLSL